MKDESNQIWSELEPVGLAPEGTGWQQRKSSETRTAILEAAIECLARYGYSRTTTQLISKAAKVSRGAMLHHYATKRDLITSVTEYAFYKHMENFSRSIRALTEHERVDVNVGIRVDWRSYFSREYKAYLELNIASRTDKELRAIFLPRARRHDRIWRDELLRVFPEWSHDLGKLERTRRFVRAVLEGMIINRDIWNDAKLESSLLNFIVSTVSMIRRDELKFTATQERPRRGE